MSVYPPRGVSPWDSLLKQYIDAILGEQADINDQVMAAIANNPSSAFAVQQGLLLVKRSDPAPGAGKINYSRASGNSGTPDFEIVSKSFANGSGKPPNVATWIGYNARRYFQDGSGQAGLLGWHLGFEPGYQNPDDGTFGPEFYLNYTSPDNLAVPIAVLRPFYIRLLNGDTNSLDDKAAHTLFNIGRAAGGIFTIGTENAASSVPPLFQATRDAITMAVADIVAQGALAVRPATGAAILRVDGTTAAIEMRVGGHAYGGGLAQSTVDALEIRDKVGEPAMVFNYGAVTNQRVIGANGRMHVSSVIQAGAISGIPALTPTANLGTGAPAPTVVGNCTRGTVSFGTGTSPAAGDIIEMTLPTAYQATPTVVVSPGNFATGAQPVYAYAVDEDTIRIGITGALPASQAGGTYKVSYQIIG